MIFVAFLVIVISRRPSVRVEMAASGGRTAAEETWLTTKTTKVTKQNTKG